MAYVGKLMVERKVKVPSDLGRTGKPLEASSNYRKAVRFADPELKKLLEGCNEQLLAARRALEQQLTGGRLLLKMPLPRRRPPSMSGRISRSKQDLWVSFSWFF